MSKKLLSLVLATLLVIALPVTSIAAGTDEDVLIKTVTFTSSHPQATYTGYDERITEEGAEYIQEGEIAYAVLKETKLTAQETLLHMAWSDPMYEKAMDAADTVTVDGMEYTLTEISYEPAYVPNRRMSVSGYTEWTNVTVKPVPAESKRVSYYDEATDSSASADLPLVRFEQVTDLAWREIEPIQLTFEIYDAELYLLGDRFVPYSDTEPALTGYESDVLALLQLDPAVYQIDGFTWSGEVYEENGMLCRKAIATGRKYCASYRADYQDTVKLKDAPGWQGTAVYSAEHTVETGEIEYTIEARIPYVPEGTFPVVPVTTGGVTVGVGLVLWFTRPPVTYYDAAGKLVGRSRIRRGRADVTKAKRKAGATVTATVNKGYVRRHVGQDITFVSEGAVIGNVRLPMTKDKFTHVITQ